MKTKLLLLIVVAFLLSFKAFTQTAYTYDFNSIPAGTAINGVDGWKSTYETVYGGDFEVNYSLEGTAISPDNSVSLLYKHGGPGVGQTASRKTTPALPFDFSAGGIIEIEVKMLVNWWGVGFGWGYDANDNGTMNFGSADANDGGCWFYLKNANNANHDAHFFKKPDGTTVNFTYDNSVSAWNVFKFSIDFTANSGKGAITMSAKTPTGVWQTIPQINSLNLDLTPGSNDKKDPAKWKTLFLHSQGGVGGFDDIVIRQYTAGYQYIVFESIPSLKLTTDPPFALRAYTNHGLPVNFTVTGPATISNDTILTITGAGTVTVTAHQPGSGPISPAADVSQTFEAIDGSTVIPVVDVKNPVNGVSVRNPNLIKIPVSVYSSIQYPELLSVTDLKFVVGSDEYTMTSLDNDYFIYYWAPSAYGSYTAHVKATSSAGVVYNSPDFTFEVIQDSSEMQFTAIDHLHMAPFTDFGVLKILDTTVVFPSYTGTYKKVTAYLYYDCPADGCEPWDRTCRITSRGANGEYIELLRYITPYGKACSDSVDVTDIMSQLQGKVDLHIEFPARSKITLMLKYHKGSQDYNYSWVEKVWYNQYYAFGTYGALQSVETKSVMLQNATNMDITGAILRITSSGHAWGENNTGNATEFKEATHNIKVNGTTVYTQHLWQTCNPNPTGCNSQAGTWQYNRAGWCPGSMPILWRFDLKNYLKQNIELVYQFDPSYTDYCSTANPNCNSSTCPNCEDPSNPYIDVAANLIKFFDGVSSINELNTIQFEAYPNPSNGMFNLKTSDDISLANVSIFDARGNEVKKFTWNGEQTIVDLTVFSQGIYIMKVQTSNGISVRKLIIN